MTDLNEKWGTVRFKIFELAVMRRCLDSLEIFEMVLNKGGETIVPLKTIEQERSKLDNILADYNLRNLQALLRSKKVTIKMGEWKTLQNALCITIGMQEGINDGLFPKELLLSERTFKIVKGLHRGFELFPTRIFAGLKARGYKIDEEKARKFIEEYKTHEPDAAITKLATRDGGFIERAKERYESNYHAQQDFLSTFQFGPGSQNKGGDD